MADVADLDGLIRRVDPDRWLASRFIADEAARAGVIALYAFNHELERAALVASQPLVGEIRLAWWREAVEEIAEGRPVRRHPAAQALAGAVSRGGVAAGPLLALVEGHLRDLDGWPLGAQEVEGYVDGASGRLMALAAGLLSPAADPGHVIHAGSAWGLSRLARLGRLPPEWPDERVRRQVDDHLARAGAELKGLPPAAFPAVAYAALSRPYARGETPSELGKRLRLMLAVARGRI